MVELPTLILPREFLGLLKYSNPSDMEKFLGQVMQSSPALHLAVLNAFSEFNEHHISIDKVAINLGWDNFRNRLASFYILKAMTGLFPGKTDLNTLDEIIAFETRFKEKTQINNGRLFMFGFYLKMVSYHYLSQDSLSSGMHFGPAFEDYFSFITMKVEKIDWLLILLWHLDQGLGRDKLMQSLAAQKNWYDLYALLDFEQRKSMVFNLLSYGASIGEDDPFVYERV
jgi:hypothetical protein